MARAAGARVVLIVLGAAAVALELAAAPASAGGSLTPPLPLSTAARQPVMLPECRCRSR